MTWRPRPLLPCLLALAIPAAAADDPEAKLPYCSLEVGTRSATLARNEDPSSAEAVLLVMNPIGDWKKAGTLAPVKGGKASPLALAARGHYRIAFDIEKLKRDMTFTLNQAASFTLTGTNLISKSKTLSVKVETKGQTVFTVKDSTLTLLD